MGGTRQIRPTRKPERIRHGLAGISQRREIFSGSGDGKIAKIESLPEIIAEMSKPVDHSMSHNRGRNGLFPVPCWPYVPEAHERETDALERWPAVDVSDDPDHIFSEYQIISGRGHQGSISRQAGEAKKK